MRRWLVVLIAITLPIACLAFAPTAKADYIPPIGIPAPSFGINESHMMYDGQTYSAGGFTYRDAGNGPYTHYVDNTHPNATNVANPYGTADTPRADIFDGSLLTLPPGSVVELHGGPYTYTVHKTFTVQGTADKPVFIRAADVDTKVTLQGNGSSFFGVSFSGSYAIIENCDFYKVSGFAFAPRSDHLALRFSEVHNPPGTTLSGGAGVNASGYTEDIVIYKNHIHHNWKGNSEDCHGVNISSGAQRIWVLENLIHDNSGDAFQGSHYANPAPRYVYVGKNTMFNDRENGVDLKTIHDVIISQNTLYGYRSSSTSIGDAIVVGSNGVTPGRSGPIRAWILFNNIYDSQTGIRVEGANDCWLIGNTVHHIIGDGIILDIDPDSTNINIIGNTITSINSDGLVNGRMFGATEFRFENNILSNIGFRHVSITSELAAEANLKNNLFWDNDGNILVHWGEAYFSALDASQINELPNCSGNIIGDPLFVDSAENNYSIPESSPAVDAGTGSMAYQIFFDLYGIDIRADFDGSPRPANRIWDIGAFEWGQKAQVISRHIFYNNSAWDGNDAGASAADDAAIAADKTALLKPGTATFSNYTSYWRGINGIMFDVLDLPAPVLASDFKFKVGNHSNPLWWSGAPDPSSISLRKGDGENDSDRITITWPGNAIVNQWLEVTYLPAEDVFYFGNAIGETGDSITNARVTPTDQIYIRNNPANLTTNPASITHAGDFNRDKRVGPTDAIICRNNGTNSSTALQLITAVDNEVPTVTAGTDARVDIETTILLSGSVNDDGYPDPPGLLTMAWSKLSGPGTVSFANPSEPQTTMTFSEPGIYVLELKADDGVLSATDTVQIDVFGKTTYFGDDFEDDNLDGWTALAGSFDTFQFIGETNYEVHATAANSHMRADLVDTNLDNMVFISFKVRHTGGAPGGIGGDTGNKTGQIWFVDDSGAGFGLYIILSQDGAGILDLYSTTDDGATMAFAGSYAAPAAVGGNDLKQVELVYNRVTDQVECFYESTSIGTVVGVNSAYRDFTRVVVSLAELYTSFGDPVTHVWGQLDFDDIGIANYSRMN